jgi:hypothetical protein
MIMTEIIRQNRHLADTVGRKTCQTAKEPDINDSSFLDRNICRKFMA